MMLSQLTLIQKSYLLLLSSLFHRDRGRSDEFILDLPGCSSSQIQSEAIPKEPDPTQEVSTQTDATDVPAPADMSSMMAELSSYTPFPKPTSSDFQECYDWIVNFESFLHKLDNSIPSDPSWKDLKVEEYHQVVNTIFRTRSISNMLNFQWISRKFSGFPTKPEVRIRSINQLIEQIIQKLKTRAVPDPEGLLYDDRSRNPARLRSSNRSSSRCRRKDSRSW